MSDDATPAYERAYKDLVQATLTALSNVRSAESAQEFMEDTIGKVRQRAQMVPEFYPGEFVQLLKEAELEQRQSGIAALELIVEKAEDEGKVAGAELTARLAAARKAGDRAGQHAVWREREARLAAVQAKVDNATAQLRIVGIRRKACDELAAALGF